MYEIRVVNKHKGLYSLFKRLRQSIGKKEIRYICVCNSTNQMHKDLYKSGFLDR